jgi:hypothetical protein
VAAPQTELEQHLLSRLSAYLTRVLIERPVVVRRLDEVRPGRPAILLSAQESPVALPFELAEQAPEAWGLATLDVQGHPLVVAVGRSDRGLKRAVQRLIIESRQERAALVVPETSRTAAAWIPHREWTVCPWTPLFVRGMFVNPHADRRLDMTLYSDRQLADYVEMMDWFGYSGCQIMETSYSYGVFGSIEGFQDWQRRLALAVRANGQQVSLWVWAAMFSGMNWNDPQVLAVDVPRSGAFDDPATRAVFEKYYDHYARLAPLVDRVFGHFYDPGVLTDREDVFKYMRLLEEKFKARNPGVQMGIDFWAAGADYVQQLIARGFQDYLLLQNGSPIAQTPGSRERLHRLAKAQGLRLGVWGWYLTEYETDQLASLYVNTYVLKNVYDQIRKEGTDIYPVEYWSEMDAHHLNNIYSMYIAGQLLWDPERDPRELLRELVLGIWGPVNGPVVLPALELIQDVRSGPTWGTYWWTSPQYRIGTPDAAGDLRRAKDAIAALETMKPDPVFVPKFPLPFPPEVFVELMLPHLRQIQLYSEFRMMVEEMRDAERRVRDQDLQRVLDRSFQPIPEFNTWVGTLGTPELRAQERLLREVCDELNLKVKYPPGFRYLEADRLLQWFQSRQRATKKVFLFNPEASNEFFWGKPKLYDRLQKLVEDGVVQKVGSTAYRLKQ